MNNKFITWLRWIFLLPGAIIAGFLATFPLHWILYFLLNGAETDLGSLKSFAQLLSFGASWKEAEFLLSPFIIALVYIISGVEIAPKHKLKTAIILFVLYLLTWGGIVLISFSQGTASTQLSSRTILAIIGAVLGLIVVLISKRRDNKADIEG